MRARRARWMSAWRQRWCAERPDRGLALGPPSGWRKVRWCPRGAMVPAWRCERDGESMCGGRDGRARPLAVGKCGAGGQPVGREAMEMDLEALTWHSMCNL